MTNVPRELHLRIGRVVVEAPAGADRHALAAALAHDLPAALHAQLGAWLHGAVQPPGSAAAPASVLGQHVATAVAGRVSAALRSAAPPSVLPVARGSER